MAANSYQPLTSLVQHCMADMTEVFLTTQNSPILIQLLTMVFAVQLPDRNA